MSNWTIYAVSLFPSHGESEIHASARKKKKKDRMNHTSKINAINIFITFVEN